MKYSVVIPAAGSGSRMNLGYNKAYYVMGECTILEHTMNVFLQDEDCEQVIVVSDPEFYKTHTSVKDPRVFVTEGGSDREASVYNGLKLVKSSYVLIHDGARPYLPQECLQTLKEELVKYSAVCLMIPCKDTIKVVKDGVIEKTLERSTLMAAQTPQAFKTELLKGCFEKAMADHFSATDDCSIVEAYSDVPIHAVEGSYKNFKITTIEDIEK